MIFVRHGQTVWNSEGRWQGRLNSPLSPLGIQQAREAHDALRATPIDAAYSSDAGRAYDTGCIILEGRNPGLVAHPGLRERDYGVYEGFNAAEIEERFPGSRFRDSSASREEWRPPNGETMAQVRERVAAVIREVAARHPGKTVLMATHSGAIRAVDSICQKKSFDEIWDRVPPNGCIFVIRATADGKIEVIQDCFETPSIARDNA